MQDKIVFDETFFHDLYQLRLEDDKDWIEHHKSVSKHLDSLWKRTFKRINMQSFVNKWSYQVQVSIPEEDFIAALDAEDLNDEDREHTLQLFNQDLAKVEKALNISISVEDVNRVTPDDMLVRETNLDNLGDWVSEKSILKFGDLHFNYVNDVFRLNEEDPNRWDQGFYFIIKRGGKWYMVIHDRYAFAHDMKKLEGIGFNDHIHGSFYIKNTKCLQSIPVLHELERGFGKHFMKFNAGFAIYTLAPTEEHMPTLKHLFDKHTIHKYLADTPDDLYYDLSHASEQNIGLTTDYLGNEDDIHIREIANRIIGFNRANYLHIADNLKSKFKYGFGLDLERVREAFFHLELEIDKLFGTNEKEF